MAVLSFTNAWNTLREAVQLLTQIDSFVQTATTGFLAKELDALDIIMGGSPDRARITTALASTRSAMSAVEGSAADILTGPLLLIGEAIGSASRDPVGILLDLRVYFDDQGETILYRNFTYGAKADVGSPNGDGLVLRVTQDAFGNNIERIHADVISMKVVRDQVIGGTDPGKEVWQLEGRPTGPDQLEIDNSDRGSGLLEQIAAQEAIDSIVPNASFSNADSDSAPTLLTGWKWDDSGTLTETFAGDGSDIEIDRTNYYRASKQLEGDNPGALSMNKAIRLVAALGADGRGGLDDRFPYIGCIAINPTPGTYSGKFRARIGGMTMTQASPGAGWVLEVFPLTSGDNWPENFNEIPPTTFFEVETYDYVSGKLKVDHFLCHPAPSYDGHFLSFVGRTTDWKKNDKATITDTHSATPGQIQTWLWRTFGVDLASAASPSLAD